MLTVSGLNPPLSLDEHASATMSSGWDGFVSSIESALTDILSAVSEGGHGLDRLKALTDECALTADTDFQTLVGKLVKTTAGRRSHRRSSSNGRLSAGKANLAMFTTQPKQSWMVQSLISVTVDSLTNGFSSVVAPWFWGALSSASSPTVLTPLMETVNAAVNASCTLLNAVGASVDAPGDLVPSKKAVRRQLAVRLFARPPEPVWTDARRAWLEAALAGGAGMNPSMVMGIMHSMDVGRGLREQALERVQAGIDEKAEGDLAGEWEDPRGFKNLVAWAKSQYSASLGEILLIRPEAVAKKLERAAALSVLRVRSGELFDMAMDFPASVGGLNDVREATAVIGQPAGSQIASALGTAVRSRLTIPGAKTEAVLQGYVAVARAAATIDRTGEAAGAAAAPVEAYLGQRSDALPIIVHAMTSDPESELYAALHKPPPGPVGGVARRIGLGRGAAAAVAASMGGEMDALSDEEEGTARADPAVLSRWVPMGARQEVDASRVDIVQAVVGLVGGPAAVVEEYERSFARKMMELGSSPESGAALDASVADVEFFKLRFGEEALRKPEIMLKDVMESRRLLATLGTKKSDLAVTPLVLSRLFWPKLSKKDDLVLPQPMQEAQAEFDRAYGVAKAPRTLKWVPGAGLVVVEVAGTEHRITPAQAAVISAFGEAGTWSRADLEEKTGLAGAALMNRGLRYWIRAGVLVVDGDSIRTKGESGSEESGGDGGASLEEEEAGGDEGMVGKEEEVKQAVAFYRNAVTMMLRSTGPKDAGEMVNRLRLFGFEDVTPGIVKVVLKALMAEEVVEQTDGGKWVFKQ